MIGQRFDLFHLRTLAGDEAFELGQAYADLDVVEFTILTDDMIAALIEDAELYAVVVAGGGRQFGGGCNCEAFDEAGICKHMVAVAIAVNRLDEDAAVELETRTTALHEYLSELDPDELAGMLLSRAAVDPALLHQLLIEAGLEEEGGGDGRDPRAWTPSQPPAAPSNICLTSTSARGLWAQRARENAHGTA